MTRLTLIGYGRWGENIARTLGTLPDVSVSVIEKGEQVQRATDGILVATPSATHAEIALPYIEQGIPTFIEKPMTISVEDALRIREAARRSGAVVFVGHIHLFNPAFNALKENIGEIGRIRAVLCEGANNNPREDSSIFWDWLPHDLSMARALFSEEPRGAQGWHLAEGALPPVALSKFVFGEAVLMSTLSWSSPTKRKVMTVVGTEGSFEYDDTALQKLALRKRGKISHIPHEATLPLTNELGAFVHSVRTGEKVGPDVEDGLSIVRAIAAAEESARQGGREILIDRGA